MNLEQIQEMWSKDCIIDDVMLDSSSMRIPQLHAKYITLHNEYSLLLKKAKQELDRTKHLRTLYYSGRGTEHDGSPDENVFDSPRSGIKNGDFGGYNANRPAFKPKKWSY